MLTILTIKTYLEEPVQDTNGEVESLLQQVELLMDLDEPVDQYSSHLWQDATAGEFPEVVRSDLLRVFHLSHVSVDFVDILDNELGILSVVPVDVLDRA